MVNFLMESVIISFSMGGIFGAVVALLLKHGRQWMANETLACNTDNDRTQIRRR
jgi:hypothetical protein